MAVSFETRRKEYVETTVIFVVFLAIYWFKRLINDLLQFSFSSTFAWAVQISLFTVTSLCLLFVMEKIVRKRSFSTVGFRLPTNKMILSIFSGLFVLFLIVRTLQHVILEIPFRFLGVNFLSGVILGPFVEETVFRGLIQTRLEAGLRRTRMSTASWILSSLLFVVYHIIAWFLISGKTLTVYSVTQLISVLILGIAFGFLFAKTRSLLPPFLLHAANNFTAFPL